MTVGSLFSGVGGLDLGFERAGFEIRWMCEQNTFCQKVLRKHWPGVPIYDDVRTLSAERIEPVDCIIGGFPCQNISVAGKGEGLDGEQSRLWWEMFGAISLLRPFYAVLENVPALTGRGLDAVLGALSEIGYDAEWTIVSAAAVGAPHIRERIFVVAYTQYGGLAVGRRVADTGAERGRSRGIPRGDAPRGSVQAGTVVADASSSGRQEQNAPRLICEAGYGTGRSVEAWDKSHAESSGRYGSSSQEAREYQRRVEVGGSGEYPTWTGGRWGMPEPVIYGVVDGVSNELDFVRDSDAPAIRGYGNAVVPQVSEYVARCVRAHAEHLGIW